MEVARRLVLMVMVDALRHDFITERDAPFLLRMAQSGVHGSLSPSFGFEPDGAYFAGETPEEADGGAQFWVKPGDRLFRAVPMFRLLHAVPIPSWRLVVRKATRAIAQLLASDPVARRMASPALIPFNQLARFSLSLKRIASDPLALGGRSLFEYARKMGLNVHFHGFPEHAVKTRVVLDRTLAECRGQHDFAFLFMGDLDGVGHQFGPDSDQRRTALRGIDDALAQMVAHLRGVHGDVVLVVFGDHGMAQVRGHVDVRPAIRAAGLDVRHDTWFLDSTMARFWVPDMHRRQRLKAALEGIAGGRLLTERDREAYRIRYSHNWFGDEIFAVDDHLLVHPSYYAADVAPLGMHGYLPGCRDNESAFLIAGDGIPARPPREREDMRRLFPTMLELLGIRYEQPGALRSLLS